MSILLGGVVRISKILKLIYDLLQKNLVFTPIFGAVVNSSPGIDSEVWKNPRLFLTT